MTLTHPLEAVPVARRARVFVALCACAIVVMAIMLAVGSKLRGPAAPQGIISFELAGTAARAQAMIAQWSQPDVRVWAGFSLGFDYLFMALYSTSIAAALVFLSSSWRRGRSAALVLAWLAWLAAALDAVENACLTRLLLVGVLEGWALAAAVAAWLKFALLAPALLLVLAALLARWLRRA